MVTAEELTLAIKAEGVGETRSQLEGVEGAMDDTAASAGQSAEELEGFSQQFSGAMSAAVAALAVGAAGLLSQVPVLGEAFGGLAAIVEAVAFQMDSVLRPVLQPLTQFFFNIAGAIFEAEGAVGSLIGVLATVVSVATLVITTIAAVGAQLGTFASVGAGVVSILGTIAGAITGAIVAIASLPVALIAAIAAVVAFAAAYALNLGGVRDTTNRLIGQAIDFIVGGFNSLMDRAIPAIKNFASGAADVFTTLAEGLADWAGGLASDAFEWGKGLIQEFISGIQSATNAAGDYLTELGGALGIDLPSGGTPAGATGGTSFTSSASTAFSGLFGGDGGGAQIDGRQLTESTGRYRAGPSRRRGL